MVIKPFRIFEGTSINGDGKEIRSTYAIYPPQYYDHFQSWACALRFSFAPDAFHLAYGRDASHSIERALEEAYGCVELTRVHLAASDGFDFATFTERGYTLPWVEETANHPASASYREPYRERKIYPTPTSKPIREWRGWRTDGNAEMEQVTGAVYAPEIDEDGRWGCVVRCPAIFDSNKRIFGIDAEQSIELADWFLRDLWNFNGIMPQLEQIELTYAARFR